ncbi:hypothetical protein RHGRI_008499 [Rhododendron griersonianum]|uniref:Glycosyl transferase CAP10 domain-containing protein n=1 Tax=Rhododendron griersonianum TaxID=479676 RepID=A0AAV6L2K2_9ERIC|nr:hypothetical protein RHGRI_008499 [Rhododendron griersonianum]
MAEMVERAWPASNFRLVIVDGRAYVDRHKMAPQTSDVFTLWGILQLLRRYPGKLPDLDLMFSVTDRPIIKSEDYNATTPPPLFQYCGEDDTVNIVFPNWSFWGWYKIYVEGIGWSVSEKYILACNSVALLVKSRYYDFFSRGLMPMHHYWPINDQGDKCRSIKFAVEWGNSHEQEAQDIGKAGSNFIREDLKMDHVYDYMFHVLSEYAKLLRYKPTIPERALEICSETLSCSKVGVHKMFMMESMVKGPTDVSPCNMPPPYDALAFQALLERKANAISQVELWEKKYWENQTKNN